MPFIKRLTASDHLFVSLAIYLQIHSPVRSLGLPTFLHWSNMTTRFSISSKRKQGGPKNSIGTLFKFNITLAVIKN